VVDDIRLAVTEACTNAFVHAYEAGQHAPLHVTAATTPDAVEIAIRDWGTGFRVDGETGGLGLGLPLLHELAKRVEVIEMPDAGIEVRMRFEL
jgi:anti-sigma regulatory factor (Ser/Thr protein kinase)